MNWFVSLQDTGDKTERWRKDYNEFHPHSAILTTRGNTKDFLRYK